MSRRSCVVGEGEAIVVRPRVLVLATGAHDGIVAFPGNDLPGSSRRGRGALLAQHGIAIGDRVAVLGDGPYASAFRHCMEQRVEVLSRATECHHRERTDGDASPR